MSNPRPYLVTASSAEHKPTGRAYVYAVSMAEACRLYAKSMGHLVDCSWLVAKAIR